MYPTLLLSHMAIVAIVFALGLLYFYKFSNSPKARDQRRLRKLRKEWKGKTL